MLIINNVPRGGLNFQQNDSRIVLTPHPNLEIFVGGKFINFTFRLVADGLCSEFPSSKNRF
jgi:hypothetical protein